VVGNVMILILFETVLNLIGVKNATTHHPSLANMLK